MTITLFLHALTLFGLAWAVLLESRHSSAIPLGHHLGWLGASTFVWGLDTWMRILPIFYPRLEAICSTASLILFPLAAILLIRFGIGLVGEAGPLPAWLEFAPTILFVPSGLIAAYAVVVLANGLSELETWSRQLLFLPGNLLAAYGFFRQWRILSGRDSSRHLMLLAAVAFTLNGIVSGAVVDAGTAGLAEWLSTQAVTQATGVAIEVWRMIASLFVAAVVVGALNVFEAERAMRLQKLSEERRRAEAATLAAQSEARQIAETWTEGLVSISRRIASLEPIDEVLIHVVSLAAGLLKADTATLGLFEDKDLQDLRRKCYAVNGEAFPGQDQRIENAIIQNALREGRSTCYGDCNTASSWIDPVTVEPAQAAAIVPLQLDGRLLGGLWVTRTDDRPFVDADLIGLERLADQTVIALEHALMAGQLQSLAVVEERSRIAREMHDSLAQILGYTSLELQTLEALVAQGDEIAVLDELKKARRMIKGAQADVRESILSLRTTLADDKDLVTALEQYTEEFGIQTGIQAEFSSNASEDQELMLSALAETQLVRIVQEALTNVRKHARASSVHVRLIRDGDRLRVTVEDDGIGFSAARVAARRFGLHTMRERAESVGGTTVITSSHGAGTRVEILLPFVRSERLVR